ATLFYTEGSTIAKVPGEAGFDPQALTDVNGTLIYNADDSAHGNELHAVGTSELPPLTVHLKTQEPDGEQDGEIEEGGSVVFTAVASEEVVKYLWDFEGDGHWVKDGRKPTHLYQDNLPGIAAYKARVKAFAADGRVASDYVNLYVKNVPPKVKVVVP